MELREYRYFLAVMRENSIKLAAESLNITQPGLTKVIQRMEDELGTKLFIRGNRKITPTEDAHLLRKRAEEIVELVDKTEMELTNNDSEISGEIFIGGGETTGMAFIAKAMKKIHEKNKNIHFNIFSGDEESVTEKLDKGLIDFGILVEPNDYKPLEYKRYDYIKLPMHNTWGILMRKDSPYSNLKYIDKATLIKLPLLCSRQFSSKDAFHTWLKSNPNKLNVVGFYNLIYNASLMVEQNIGYALCIDNLVDVSSESNLCFIPLKPALTSSLFLVWKKYQIFSKASQLLLNEIKKECNIDID